MTAPNLNQLLMAFDSFPQVIFPGDYPDPSVLRAGDDFYVTHSSFNYAPGLQIWHSRDLFNWSPVCFALPEYDGDVWAPELVQHEGRFFIYYKTSGGNHVVWADEISGPWSPPVDLGVGYIDPGHVVAPDGERFLHLSDGHAIALAPDGLSTRGELQKVYEGWPIPDDWRIEGVCLEGPKLMWRDGWCYLLSAQGGTAGPATSHMVVCARAKHPLGPWENCPYNPIARTQSRDEKWWSRGHGTLVEDTNGQWWMLSHTYENGFYTLGRQTIIEPMEWSEDGWPLPMKEAIAHPTPHLKQELSDDFSGPHLGSQWRFWGEHRRARYQIQNGTLTLHGEGETPAVSAPLCCIPTSHVYDVEVEVEISEGTQAGLVLFYNPHCCTALGIDAKGAFLALHSGWQYRPQSLQKPVTRASLKMVNDHHEVDFWVRLENEEWQKIPMAVESSGFHHNVFGGFLSLRVGLFAAQNGIAQFRHFKLQSFQS